MIKHYPEARRKAALEYLATHGGNFWEASPGDRHPTKHVASLGKGSGQGRGNETGARSGGGGEAG